ncbi:MAG: hypothetical protein M3015_08765 [Bacteroidota bacterium]|nr:hypothetical protein [Bacteroidota bacterium]
MFFHGSGPLKEEEGDFDKNASIGIAWSNNLVQWDGREKTSSRSRYDRFSFFCSLQFWRDFQPICSLPFMQSCMSMCLSWHSNFAIDSSFDIPFLLEQLPLNHLQSISYLPTSIVCRFCERTYSNAFANNG